jgi:hypothetical protein
MRALPVAALALLLATGAGAQQQPPAAWQQRSALPPGKVWESVMAIDTAPCCDARRPLAAGDDRAAVATMRDRAFRDGPILLLQLDGGRTLRLVDATGEETRRHRLVAWWPQHRLYVVDVVMHEARQAYLISARDGRTTLVSAPPVLSPAGRHALAWDASPLLANDMELIDLGTDPPSIFRIDGMPACPGTAPQQSNRPDAAWLDDRRVTFRGQSPFSTDDPQARQVLRITEGKPQWEC